MGTWNNDFVWGVVITGVFGAALYGFFRTYSIALVDDAADAPAAASHTSNASYTAWTTVDKRFVGTAPTSPAPTPSVPSSVQLTTVPTILSVPKSSLSPASTVGVISPRRSLQTTISARAPLSPADLASALQDRPERRSTSVPKSSLSPASTSAPVRRRTRKTTSTTKRTSAKTKKAPVSRTRKTTRTTSRPTRVRRTSR